MLAALLCWCDARKRGMQVRLRLEDLDPQRCTPQKARALREQLDWFGLSFDAYDVQSQGAHRHAAALDALADAGALYACTCSRAQLRAHGLPAADGGFVYPNTCRQRASLARKDWRHSPHALRARLPAGRITPFDEGGLDVAQVPSERMGDPVVRRRDGAIAYQLAVVVDDAASGISHVVRGRDIAPSTATQVALMQLLSITPPTYRHHFLLCEPRGDKLAKLHGSVGADVLRNVYSAEALCGFLAHVAGLRPSAAACTPSAVVQNFAWQNVTTQDQIVAWDGGLLRWLGQATQALT